MPDFMMIFISKVMTQRLIEIHQPGHIKKFTYADAVKLLPVIKHITEKAVNESELINSQFHSCPMKSQSYEQLKVDYHHVIQDWVSKITRLGVEVKDLWLVDFDSGHGYFCWRYPEPELMFFHAYHGGYDSRKRIRPIHGSFDFH